MPNPDNQQNQPPSKSQLKREAQALQQMGTKLTELTSTQLATLPLPTDLQEAIFTAKKMTKRGAHKRQLLYIGKLLRRLDPTPIREGLAELEQESATTKARHRQLEQLCAALIEGDQEQLRTFLEDYPNADRQHLRQLAHNAVRQQQQNKPPSARRALFRYLREIKEQVDLT